MIALKVADIYSHCMTLRVERGKGRISCCSSRWAALSLVEGERCLQDAPPLPILRSGAQVVRRGIDRQREEQP